MENNISYKRLEEIITTTISTIHTYHRFAREAESNCEANTHYDIIMELYTNILKPHHEYLNKLYSPDKNERMYKFFSTLEDIYEVQQNEQ